MNNWNVQPRYWSPAQKYATGDVLITLLREGWQVIDSAAVHSEGPALLHSFTLAKIDTVMTIHVLDCPAVRDVLCLHSTPHSHAA
jgi:hypothetical protein